MAESLPAGINQRPGVTLLLGRRGPLTVELLDQGVRTGWAFLLAPEQRRRFVEAQPHYSITVEPAHPLYASYLAWAHETARSTARQERLAVAPHDAGSVLEQLSSGRSLDAWLRAFLVRNHVEIKSSDAVLLDLFAKLREAELAIPDPTAEDVWRSFRAKRPGDQAYWSRWLHAQIGISLRTLLLWRKMRRAIEAAAHTRHATSVAHVAGFADSAHLSRVCLRMLGVRPSEVRNDKTVQVTLLAAD